MKLQFMTKRGEPGGEVLAQWAVESHDIMDNV